MVYLWQYEQDYNILLLSELWSMVNGISSANLSIPEAILFGAFTPSCTHSLLPRIL